MHPKVIAEKEAWARRVIDQAARALCDATGATFIETFPHREESHANCFRMEALAQTLSSVALLVTGRDIAFAQPPSYYTAPPPPPSPEQLEAAVADLDKAVAELDARELEAAKQTAERNAEMKAEADKTDAHGGRNRAAGGRG